MFSVLKPYTTPALIQVALTLNHNRFLELKAKDDLTKKGLLDFECETSDIVLKT